MAAARPYGKAVVPEDSIHPKPGDEDEDERNASAERPWLAGGGRLPGALPKPHLCYWGCERTQGWCHSRSSAG